MRLKTFSAPTTAEAMQLVRDEIGDDAIIVSTHRDTDGEAVRIIVSMDETGGETGTNGPADAALCQGNLLSRDSIEILSLDVPGFENPDLAPAAAEVIADRLAEGPVRLDVYEAVCRVLSHHGAPGAMTERLAHAAAAKVVRDPAVALASAKDAEFTFQPVPSTRDSRPLMLIGPPGGGKPLTTAKLAARGVMAGHSVGVVTTDAKRAGAIEQLAAFTRVLKIDLQTAATPSELVEAVVRLDGHDAVYIDSAAVNPFLNSDMSALKGLIRATGADPLLVLPAGGDALEAADMGQAFADAGAGRMIVTRLDLTRRLGGVLAAAERSRLSFSGGSTTPRVSKGLNPISAVSLARLVMPEAMPKPETEDKQDPARMAGVAS